LLVRRDLLGDLPAGQAEDDAERREDGVHGRPLRRPGRKAASSAPAAASGSGLARTVPTSCRAPCWALTYTDHIDAVRRLKPTTPAAEIQQHLLPPRILRIGGALIAGNVLPGYDIGGDWFDYAENPDGAWIGIADTQGKGPTAAGLGTVTLGAFRAARQRSTDPAEALATMHAVLTEVARDDVTATATVACWNGAASTITWLTCGEHAPILITADGELEVLGDKLPALGHPDMPAHPQPYCRRIAAGERLLLLSDGVRDRATLDGGTLGLDGILDVVSKAPAESAAGTLRAIEDAVREATTDPLSDDATVVVLVPSRSAPR
jgi:serine phosphatase RsbU (regulator of sigma subunit)